MKQKQDTFKETKKKFEERITSIYINLRKSNVREEDVNLTLYYEVLLQEDEFGNPLKHIATWSKGSGWVYIPETCPTCDNMGARHSGALCPDCDA